eukprot:3458488-Alexandrium_andersonii.AAC.1
MAFGKMMIWCGGDPVVKACCSKAELYKVIPWGIHGDEVSVARQGAGEWSLEVMSSSSRIGRGSTLDTHFLFAAWPSTIDLKK